MAKLETVAKLLGWKRELDPHHSVNKRVWWASPTQERRQDGQYAVTLSHPPAYDTDANASRELLAYVAKERRIIEFVTDLHRIIGDEVISDCGSNWAMLNATPQQIYAAFCATFARELEQVEKQS